MTDHRSFWGVAQPGQDEGWVLRPSQDGGGRVLQPGQVRTWRIAQPGQDGVLPDQGWGTPQDRTPDGVLDTQLAVCLLHSHRRTVLFEIIYMLSNHDLISFFILLKTGTTVANYEKNITICFRIHETAK